MIETRADLEVFNSFDFIRNFTSISYINLKYLGPFILSACARVYFDD